MQENRPPKKIECQHFTEATLCPEGGFSLALQTKQWKAFDDFHAIVSKILHPVITGNVQSVKKNSALLLNKAQDWQALPIPETVDSAVFKPRITALVNQCNKLNDAVKSRQKDAVLIKEANTVHETFHDLLKACKLKD